jgi:hypothetical protein
MADTYDTLDPRQILSAPPGWVARRLHLDERTNSIETDYLPVVGWAIGAEIHGGRAPVIWNIGAQEIGIPAELEAADDWSGFLDTYLFDPDALGAAPEVDETAARERLMGDGDFQAWVAERRQSRARLVGHSPTD